MGSSRNVWSVRRRTSIGDGSGLPKAAGRGRWAPARTAGYSSRLMSLLKPGTTRPGGRRGTVAPASG